MNQEAIWKLKNRLSQNALEDDEDLTQFIQFSSRMAALGDSSEFDRIPEIAARPTYAGRLDEILTERCKMGIWDLEEQEGQELALSLIEAQDFALFCKRTENSGLYAKTTWSWLETWAIDAQRVSLNNEAVEVLEDWKETYPLEEEDLIGTIAYPMTEFEHQILWKTADQIPDTVIETSWGTSKASRQTAQEISPEKHTNAAHQTAYRDANLRVVCDDGAPSDWFIRKNTFSVNVQTPVGEVTVKRSLSRRWKIVLDLTKKEGDLPYISGVNVGGRPAVPSAERPGRWTADLHLLPETVRMKYLKALTSLRLDGICVLKIAYEGENK